MKCNCCKIWFSNYEPFCEHVCYHSSNLGPFPCGSAFQIPLFLVLDLYDEGLEILVCEACVMFFCTVACLQTHQQICARNPQAGIMRGWRSSYGNIRPWRTLEPVHHFRSFFVTGAPFRRLRAGCEDCLGLLHPSGRWLGASSHAEDIRRTLIWATWTISLMLRRAYQNRQVKPTLLHLQKGNLPGQYAEIRNLLLEH